MVGILRRVPWVALLFPILVLASERAVLAADQTKPGVVRQAAPDFLFGRPRASIAMRASWLNPRESGDLFAFVRDQLTLKKGDFKTGAFSVDVGLTTTDRTSLLVGFEATQRSIGSEYRHFVGNDGLPINQRTRIGSQLLQSSFKIALLPPGHRVSRYAWVPRGITPFVGAGGGVTHYSFVQDGEFVDYQKLSVFKDRFVTAGWVPSIHVLAGADVHVWRFAYLTLQSRYVRTHARPGTDFVGFNSLDLSGLRTETGLMFVF